MQHRPASRHRLAGRHHPAARHRFPTLHHRRTQTMTRAMTGTSRRAARTNHPRGRQWLDG